MYFDVMPRVYSEAVIRLFVVRVSIHNNPGIGNVRATNENFDITYLTTKIKRNDKHHQNRFEGRTGLSAES